MQHTTKMVMVPEDAYSSLVNQQQQLMPPVAMQLSNLDTEMKSILNNPNLSTDQKYDRYFRTFNRYSQLQGRQFYPPSNPLPEEPIVEQGPKTNGFPILDAVVDSLPRVARTRGKLLTHHLKQKKEIQWSDKGELMADGTPIPGSNITDLIHFFTRDRPSVKPPVGAKQFASQLQDTNVPMEAVAGDSFNQAGTLDFHLGTLFSPVAVKTPKKPRRNAKKGTPQVRKAKQPSASASGSPLGKRKQTEPQRLGLIKWEDWDI